MRNSEHKGYLCPVLQAHLPYIRHPEYDYFLEENWLYEAMTETYIPLIDVFSRLIDDGVDFRITLSFSPALIEMFNDELLMSRYKRHIERLLEVSEKERRRTKRDIHFGPLAGMYRKKLLKIRRLFEEAYKKDLVSVLRQLQDTGNIEIITTAATHAFLPNLSSCPEAVKAQIKIGSRHYRKNFGRRPEGMWLPECGFIPGFDNYMKEEDFRFFFLDTHGIMRGAPVPTFGVYLPVSCPSGVAAFGRDTETSRQVWSAAEGYPGDADYRDFYRDIGFDLDQDHVKSFLHPYGARTYTGFKYYRITGRTDRKKPYVRKRAMKKAKEHARDFIMKRDVQVNLLSETLKIKPVIAATYDAELFGHWWFEGPEWLGFLLEGIYQKHGSFTTITPSEYLELQAGRPGRLQACEPSMSSWGERGYSEVWLNISNDYVYRHLLKAAERMTYLADRFPDAKGVLLKALNQAAREVLLSQHSDWTFIIKSNTSAEYARKRIEAHIGRFTALYQAVISGHIPEKWLAEIEDKDRIFRDIDYKVYKSR
jgi:1,4-alpha-glucan branching enzyme